jgi:TM2 domain-containing membrane protein YozV
MPGAFATFAPQFTAQSQARIINESSKSARPGAPAAQPGCWHVSCIFNRNDQDFIFSHKEPAMGSGYCGNVIAALASFFIPGLGQLLQGRWLLAGFMFLLTALLWLILLGWIIHLWSIIDAALYKNERATVRHYYREIY